jgi:hypothetical protein
VSSRTTSLLLVEQRGDEALGRWRGSQRWERRSSPGRPARAGEHRLPPPGGTSSSTTSCAASRRRRSSERTLRYTCSSPSSGKMRLRTRKTRSVPRRARAARRSTSSVPAGSAPVALGEAELDACLPERPVCGTPTAAPGPGPSPALRDRATVGVSPPQLVQRTERTEAVEPAAGLDQALQQHPRRSSAGNLAMAGGSSRARFVRGVRGEESRSSSASAGVPIATSASLARDRSRGSTSSSTRRETSSAEGAGRRGCPEQLAARLHVRR